MRWRPTSPRRLHRRLSRTVFFTRLYHAYAGEWGKAAPPSDPNAPPGRRGADQLPPQPVDSAPYPYTDWPYGGASTIGASLPGSADTPLQSALFPAESRPGKWLGDQHIQIYGWVASGGNLSSASQYGGNRPVPDIYTPNVLELDQAVVRIERVPDTVQRDHIDWGFRVTGLYGETYRYTSALGIFSNQYVFHDRFAGYDIPEAYGEIYLPQFADGLIVRIGRFFTIPDIEAQLSPGNLLYSHNISYPVDPTTNTGGLATLKLNKNWLVQAGISAGADTVPWSSKTVALPNGYVGPRDPGAKASFTGCVQWQSDSASDAIYGCIEDFNGGQWGYNNVNWFGGTYFHKFNDQWHIGVEAYYEFEKNVNSVAAGLPRHALSIYGEPARSRFLCRGPSHVQSAGLYGLRVSELQDQFARQSDAPCRIL